MLWTELVIGIIFVALATQISYLSIQRKFQLEANFHFGFKKGEEAGYKKGLKVGYSMGHSVASKLISREEIKAKYGQDIDDFS